MDTLIYFAALLIFLYGLISAVADRSPITAPMVFVAIGVLASPLGFGLFEVEYRLPPGRNHRRGDPGHHPLHRCVVHQTQGAAKGIHHSTPPSGHRAAVDHDRRIRPGHSALPGCQLVAPGHHGLHPFTDRCRARPGRRHQRQGSGKSPGHDRSGKRTQ